MQIKKEDILEILLSPKKIASIVVATLTFVSGLSAMIPKKTKDHLPTSGDLVYLEEVEQLSGKPSSEFPIDYVEKYDLVSTEYHEKIEAEDGVFTEPLSVKSVRNHYSGEGYVTGFDGQSTGSWSVTFDAPSSQHYDITLCISSTRLVTNVLMVNGEKLDSFSIDGGADFKKATLPNIYIEQGKAEISIYEVDGCLDIDYVEISNSQNSMEHELNVSDVPCDALATNKTKYIYNWMAKNYGNYTLTGQYVSDSHNKEIEFIQSLTGVKPVIRFATLNEEQVDASIAWSNQNGLVGLSWYWKAPGSDSIYSDETDFHISKAVTDVDVSQLSIEDIKVYVSTGMVSEECVELIEEIDAIVPMMEKLQDNDVTVLWRPLPVAGLGRYWWGSNAEGYQWLWSLLYHRLTEYHKIHNLIWIWNGQNKDYMVPDCEYDIASFDIYLDDTVDYGNRLDNYCWLNQLCQGKKLLGLSETSSVPNIDYYNRDSVNWSFFGLWYGEYLWNEDGSFANERTDLDTLKKMYLSDRSLHFTEWQKVMQKMKKT